MERRSEERLPRDLPLVCRIPAAPGPARVVDISERGCRINLGMRDVEPGFSVVLDLPNGDRVEGTLVWVSRPEAGVRFRRALKPGTQVFLGLIEPEREIEPEAIEDAGPQKPRSILPHWMRMVVSRF